VTAGGLGTTARGHAARRLARFLNANLISILAAGLSLLLAFFLLYPIVAVLMKSVWGPSGFTLGFETFSNRTG